MKILVTGTAGFIRNALALRLIARGDQVTVYGKGAQTRSFCYVDGLIEALLRLMNSPDDITGPVNLGNPVEFTILELARIVIKLTGSKS